jgi:hypothetical protein
LDQHGSVIALIAGAYDGQNLNVAISARHIMSLLESPRRIPLKKMLDETVVVQQISGDTVCVPAGEVRSLPFLVEADAVLEGTYKINGGLNDDIEVVLVTDENDPVWRSGRVKTSGQIQLPLPSGGYHLILDNEFSIFRSKSVSTELRLRFYR